MVKPHVVILGAGPAGLGAAFQLTRYGLADVTVLEASNWVGGIAGSFRLAGFRLDYGSHCLHPACDPAVLEDIRSFLGEDLLDRPRHSRIRLRGHWIHFPFQPLDLALRLPPSFVMGAIGDLVRKPWRQNGASYDAETFASAMEASLGHTICQDFHFPFARKVWGVSPDELSAVPARQRLSAGSLGKTVWRVVSAATPLKRKGNDRFYYPRHGFGQIAEAYYRAALKAGADIQLGSSVSSVELAANSANVVHYFRNRTRQSLHADYVWSTIPITRLVQCLKPNPPMDCLCAAKSIDYRAMILVYLLLGQDRFSEYDAHYFPDADIPISRLSEPKNYSDNQESQDLTVLCAELPCAPNDQKWNKTDAELGQLVCNALGSAGIPVRAPVKEVVTRRIRQAFPMYRRGYEKHFGELDHWLGQKDKLLTFGRQGLFAHDNVHQAIYMGYCAASCLGKHGHFDRERWQAFRRAFETQVAED